MQDTEVEKLFNFNNVNTFLKILLVKNYLSSKNKQLVFVIQSSENEKVLFQFCVTTYWYNNLAGINI